jgi:capsular polysaccharide biosynthesis protein
MVTFDLDSMGVPSKATEVEPQPPEVFSARMISLRFIMTALRRKRRLWLGLALLGLFAGVGFHLVVPPKYSATATVYLTHAPGSDDNVVSANDQALVQTAAVGQRAIAMLGEHGLTPAKLLGKVPAATVSDNILTITISGPTAKEAVRRVNAVTLAYLAFRSQEYESQNQSVTRATNAQITKLEAQLNQVTGQINALDPSTQAQQYTELSDQQSALGAQITSLQQAIQQDQLNTLAVSTGSRVLTTGTAVHLSTFKLLLLDGVTGMVAGLSIGLLFVVIGAVLSDRLWRREDIAAAFGAPVDLSLSRPRRRSKFRPTTSDVDFETRSDVRSLIQHLHNRLETLGPRPTLLVVALDDTEVPAAALAGLAASMSRSGHDVVMVDETTGRALGRGFGTALLRNQRVRVGLAPEVTMILPPPPEEPDVDDLGRSFDSEDLASADVTLVLASVEPATGAWHLRNWSTATVVTVSAGGSTAQRINAVAELLDVAKVSVTSVVLLGADTHDDSVGLPEPGISETGRRLGLVSATRGM